MVRALRPHTTAHAHAVRLGVRRAGRVEQRGGGAVVAPRPPTSHRWSRRRYHSGCSLLPWLRAHACCTGYRQYYCFSQYNTRCTRPQEGSRLQWAVPASFSAHRGFGGCARGGVVGGSYSTRQPAQSYKNAKEDTTATSHARSHCARRPGGGLLPLAGERGAPCTTAAQRTSLPLLFLF